MDDFKRRTLDEELGKVCKEFNDEMQSVLDHEGVEPKTGDFREEIARQVFYSLEGFRKAIIKALS